MKRKLVTLEDIERECEVYSSNIDFEVAQSKSNKGKVNNLIYKMLEVFALLFVVSQVFCDTIFETSKLANFNLGIFSSTVYASSVTNVDLTGLIIGPETPHTHIYIKQLTMILITGKSVRYVKA